MKGRKLRHYLKFIGASPRSMAPLLGISTPLLFLKLRGLVEFRSSELDRLSLIIGREVVCFIFFDSRVDYKSTVDYKIY